MAVVHLGLRINSKKLERITLNNINLKDTVDTLKKEAATKTQSSPENILMVHCGVVLNGTDSLEDAGISSGTMVHCLPKRDEISPPVAVPMSLSEVQSLLVSMRTVAASSNFHALIQKLRGPELVQKVLSGCPIARHDPTALAMLQDPELFMGLTNRDQLSKVVDNNPTVGRVAQFVAQVLANEITMSPRRSHHVSYSLDALSDDEDMEAEHSGDSAGGSQASDSFTPITPAQLAAALASATGSNGGMNGSSNRLASSAPRSIPTTPSAVTTTPFNTPAPSSATLAGSGLITNEMFSSALQNALAASATRASGPSSTSSSSSGPASATVQIPNIDESLQLMREMGIPDEDLSRQALQATNGDVQAAVNLIFAQWMADD